MESFVANSISKHPEHRDEILDFYQLYLDEVEAGESESNEYELLINSINETIDEHNSNA